MARRGPTSIDRPPPLRRFPAAQIISFLRRDAERKDELIESLKGTIKQQRDIFAEQRAQEVLTAVCVS